MATVLVTGCSSGFGKLTALLFGRHGHTVFATMRDVERAGPLAEVAAEEGIDVRVLALDVDDPASVAGAVGEAEAATGGGLDVVVNNAGYELRGPIEVCTDEEIRAQFETNLHGPLRVIRAVLPGMRARGSGVIVNVSSIAGLVAWPGLGAYAATKFAVVGLTKTAAAELGRAGIRVNCVHPGVTDTPMVDAVDDGVRGPLDGVIANLPLARMGRPEELAGAILFFASDDSSLVFRSPQPSACCRTLKPGCLRSNSAMLVSWIVFTVVGSTSVCQTWSSRTCWPTAAGARASSAAPDAPARK